METLDGHTTERWVIYEYPSLFADDGDEISWHKTFDKAIEVANANHAKTGLPYRIDFCWGSGGIARWECEGSEAGVYGVGFDHDLRDLCERHGILDAIDAARQVRAIR